MNKGSKFIREIMATYDKDESQRLKLQSASTSSCSSELDLTLSDKTNEKQNKIIVRKKEKNFFNRIFQLKPSLKGNHIFKLYGFGAINQKAIQNPDHNESFFYSFLSSRVIQRIEFYDYALLIQMTQPTIPLNQPPVEYLIEKFKSKGQTKFYELALIIQQLCQMMKLSQQKSQPQQKIESVKKWLDFLGDQMYVCCIGTRKVAISKSLLTYLQYDLNEFAIEAIKYRAIFNEFFSCVRYQSVLKFIVQMFKNIARFSLDQISVSQFRQLTTLHYSDFIQSKNHTRSFCNMTICMLNPTYLLHKINFVFYKEDKEMKKQPFNNEIVLTIQDEKQKIREAQYNTIKKVKAIPRHLFKKNQKLFAGYKDLEFTDKQFLQEKYNKQQ